MPSWLAQIAGALAGEFRHLPETTSGNCWRFAGTSYGILLLPVLRQLLASGQLRDTALRRIYDLAPEEGRRIILAEIREPKRHFDFSTLAMLPDASLPELDDVLAERMYALLILRYASGAVVKRVGEIYQSDPEGRFCAGPLAFLLPEAQSADGRKTSARGVL